MKRVKFVIPQKVDKGALLTAGKYSKFDGKEVPENIANCITADGIGSWLQEIKQPETFDEWFDYHHFLAEYETKSGEWIHLKYLLEKCHKWTIENEKLKREMKESSDELPEKIEEIKAGPVSANELVNTLQGYNETRDTYLISRQDLLVFVRLCERNDRKRTQPVIDAAEEVLTQKTHGGKPKLSHLIATIKQFKEQDKNRGN